MHILLFIPLSILLLFYLFSHPCTYSLVLSLLPPLCPPSLHPSVHPVTHPFIHFLCPSSNIQYFDYSSNFLTWTAAAFASSLPSFVLSVPEFLLNGGKVLRISRAWVSAESLKMVLIGCFPLLKVLKVIVFVSVFCLCSEVFNIRVKNYVTVINCSYVP